MVCASKSVFHTQGLSKLLVEKSVPNVLDQPDSAKSKRLNVPSQRRLLSNICSLEYDLMSAPETLLIPLPQCPAPLHRPISLDLNATSSGSRKMCHHSDMTISYCCGTVDNTSAPSVARMSSQDVMTYGHYMRGSIFSVPKLWQVDNGESLVVSVYSYLKTFLG